MAKKSGIKSQGLTMQRAIETEIVRKIPYEISTVIEGTIISRIDMSLENRVNMRPMGFESKKTTFALTIFLDISRCILDVLLMMMLKMVTALSIEARKLVIY